MSDLRSSLKAIDMSQQTITQGASAMMRHYDKSADTAVTEWRNALQSCREDQLLPLLYVANEVLQNSKRNRGNKFLEAFSATLGQALQFICQRVPKYVEKIRRTCKIWGDRHVFSVRFVGELLRGLEPYRNGDVDAAVVGQQSRPALLSVIENDDTNHFSPNDTDRTSSRPETPPPTSGGSTHDTNTEVTESPTAEDLMRQSSDDDDDDDSMEFGAAEASLDVTFDASKLMESSTVSPRSAKRKLQPKRRRSSSGKKRKSILSTQSLQDVWKQLTTLQQQYDQSQTLLKGIQENDLRDDNISELIGDQVMEAYSKNMAYRKMVHTERQNLYKVANGKHSLEQEARRYLPWCNAALMQDDEEVELCDLVEQDLLKLQTMHAAAQEVRDKRKALEEQAKKRHAEEKQRQEEEEERKRMLEESLAKQEEAQPGMVWNKATQEYQYLNTDESWRD